MAGDIAAPALEVAMAVVEEISRLVFWFATFAMIVGLYLFIFFYLPFMGYVLIDSVNYLIWLVLGCFSEM